MPLKAPDRRSDRLGVEYSCAFPGVRGWLPLSAVLTAVTGTLLGAVLDRSSTGTIGVGTRWGFVLGVLVAVVMVRRVSLFTAAVQPPLVFFSVVLAVFAVGSTQRVSILLIELTGAFSTLGLGTALVLIVAVLRLALQRTPADGVIGGAKESAAG